jgi:cytochrome c
MRYFIYVLTLIFILVSSANPSLSEGNSKKGKSMFQLHCQACHTTGEGVSHKVGPNLFGVFGAKAGKRDYSYERHYSKVLKQSQIIWNEQNLHYFLENPKGFLPGTKMPFVGFRNKRDRNHIIAYLKKISH